MLNFITLIFRKIKELFKTKTLIDLIKKNEEYEKNYEFYKKNIAYSIEFFIFISDNKKLLIDDKCIKFIFLTKRFINIKIENLNLIRSLERRCSLSFSIFKYKNEFEELFIKNGKEFNDDITCFSILFSFKTNEFSKENKTIFYNSYREKLSDHDCVMLLNNSEEEIVRLIEKYSITHISNIIIKII